ncbi:hypothetical protein [Tateyamaria pelophila]|uniref:hypothetical protein n=1 Tax=Tateyamaria pelophila TaxID=328415 RepID=UPI001CBC9421|nr:hypothetical protein [Tateyamaria pelophila]
MDNNDEKALATRNPTLKERKANGTVNFAPGIKRAATINHAGQHRTNDPYRESRPR